MPNENQAERMAWWRAARFGMFIHYGPVALTGKEISWSRANSNTNCPNKGATPVEIYDNRMPVIIGPEHYLWWLEPKFEPEFLKTLLRPFPAEKMDCRQVSSRVNDARNEGPECLVIV